MESLLVLAANIEKKVLDITAEPVVRDRLLEMGLAPGRRIRIVRRLPFSGPIVVQAGGLFVALRQSEAACIWVEK